MAEPEVTPPSRAVPVLLGLTAALLVWAAFFALAYALSTLACAPTLRAAGDGSIAFILAIVLLAALLAAGAVAAFAAARRRDPPRSFVSGIALASGGLVGIALAWNALPLVILGGCG